MRFTQDIAEEILPILLEELDGPSRRHATRNEMPESVREHLGITDEHYHAMERAFEQERMAVEYFYNRLGANDKDELRKHLREHVTNRPGWLRAYQRALHRRATHDVERAKKAGLPTPSLRARKAYWDQRLLGISKECAEA